MLIEKVDHLETLIGSLNKLLLDAKNKGIIRNKELSLLNLVFKLVNNNCYYDLKYDKRKELVNLYYKLLSKYSFLCKSNISLDNNTYIKSNIKEVYINTNNNTAPEIEDPEPSEPLEGMPAKLCENSKSVSVGFPSKHPFTQEELVECFIDPNNPETGTVRYMKIVSLPLYNPLTYEGVNVTVGQVIDLSLIDDVVNHLLVYTPSIIGNVEDSFTYQVSTSSFPDIYNDEIITMFIQVI